MLLVPMEDDAETNLDETYKSKDFQAPADDYHKRVIYRVKSGDTLGLDRTPLRHLGRRSSRSGTRCAATSCAKVSG